MPSVPTSVKWLERNSPTVIKHLTKPACKTILDMLQAKQIITSAEAEVIYKEKTDSDFVRIVTATVKKKGNLACTAFHDAMKTTISEQQYKELFKDGPLAEEGRSDDSDSAPKKRKRSESSELELNPGTYTLSELEDCAEQHLETLVQKLKVRLTPACLEKLEKDLALLQLKKSYSISSASGNKLKIKLKNLSSLLASISAVDTLHKDVLMLLFSESQMKTGKGSRGKRAAEQSTGLAKQHELPSTPALMEIDETGASTQDGRVVEAEDEGDSVLLQPGHSLEDSGYASSLQDDKRGGACGQPALHQKQVQLFPDMFFPDIKKWLPIKDITAKNLSFIHVREHKVYRCMTARDIILFKPPESDCQCILRILKPNEVTGKGSPSAALEFELKFNMAALGGNIKRAELYSSTGQTITPVNYEDDNSYEFEKHFEKVIKEILLPVLALYKKRERERLL
ncbi:uncharacterized protein LOC115074546 [Rhinatrema bivittatum]|uniref:uncharacterized protein LOC115074546 n=1 Tax=Rhinatrema bivittatum TaxID=194408 RepID=UPI00112AB428|nr:uncharacterized protein LOC115074546 [Rhinatrema bivittatum]